MLFAHGLSLFHGTTPLLDGVDLHIERGERVCLVGRNGTGKSTLLRVLAGQTAVDDGTLRRDPGLRVAMLPQQLPDPGDQTVFDCVAGGLGDLGAHLAEYHRLIREAPDDLDALARVQHDIEAGGGWALDTRVEAVLSRLSLDGGARAGDLSGGQRRRVWLARALVVEPDLLLLDEPTNHLDIASIRWLEDFLHEWSGAVLFVTHDRAFLRRLATRILELDRGTLTSWPGDYDNYLRRCEERQHAEELARAREDRRLAQEETWIRQGIKARRTRNEGRVRALRKLRAEVAERRQRLGDPRIAVAEAERSGRLVIEAEDVHFAWDGQPVVRGLSALVLRGDRIGLIGPNGVGKTTLLKLLLGQLAPQQGRVRLGTRLEVAWFDQLREGLDPQRSVAHNVGDGSDYVGVGESRRHIMSYLQDFLFAPDRARSPVHALSGGETARLLLARLFARPSNLLVMDEPTNDLDVETLELLEERLADYGGTVLLVSHDREFLDRAVTRSLVFEGGGKVTDIVGGYSDAERLDIAPVGAAVGRDRDNTAPAPRDGSRSRPTTAPAGAHSRAVRTVTRRIEQLEAEQQDLGLQLADGSLFRDDPERAAALSRRLAEISGALEAAYAEWEALES